MESTRPIRALMRGLDALTVLNLHDGSTVSEVAQEIRLPRTTVYRILETLCDAGFVFRDAADDRYRLSILVHKLSDGFEDDNWVTRIVKPSIDELSRDIVWPVSLATLSGSKMMVRETTDHDTPLALERYSAGFREPLLTSAAGRAFLAFCDASQRETLLDLLAQSTQHDDVLARSSRSDLEQLLAQIREQGYAATTRTRRLVEEASVGVPVTLQDRVLAVLTVRFVSSALPLKSALERLLPKLRHSASRISELFSQQQLAIGVS